MSCRIYLTGILLLAALPLWSQAHSGAQPAGEEGAIFSPGESFGAEPAGEEAPMIAPPRFRDEGSPLLFASETPRTNFLRGGLNFGTVYDDNILPTGGPAISDVRYSIWPSLSLEQSRSRLRWNLTYSPGFRFYQTNTSLDGIDHSLAIDLEYRLSPHVTLSMGEGFQKSSDVLNLSDAGVVQGATTSLVPPATTKISNAGDVGLTYQFRQNEMIGVKGAVSGLWYQNRAALNGIFDSTAGGSEVFYSHRLSANHYIGATYDFQKLFTHPGHAETETQSMVFNYTLYLPPSLTMSVFAGPQYSASHGGNTFPLRTWSPAAGASVGWRGEHTSLVASYARQINDGGGLSGAVRSNSANLSARWRFARRFTTGLEGTYIANRVLDSDAQFGDGGHTWSATVSLEHPIGERLSAQMGYTRLHQSYPNVSAIFNRPTRNNVWFSLAYRFERPLGR